VKNRTLIRDRPWNKLYYGYNFVNRTTWLPEASDLDSVVHWKLEVDCTFIFIAVLKEKTANEVRSLYDVPPDGG